jgi:Protein of unknown function DUF115
LPDTADSRVLEENLSALAARQPALADSIRHAVPDPRLVFLTARNGMDVPAVRTADGTVPFHSLYDPRRESVRFAESFESAGCVVVNGLGAGFHVTALLEHARVDVVIVVEKDAGVLKALLSRAPLAHLLGDPRLVLCAGKDGVREAILGSWQPATMGGLISAPLRAWCDMERAFFAKADAETRAAVDAVRADFSVQSHFGKRWFANIIANVAGAVRQPGAAEPAAGLPRCSEAVVTAAGPSLDLNFGRLATERRGRLLVATDTSLPALVRAGIVPDAVLSIDCQNHGYHHFLQGRPEGTALFLDLASPPLLARQASSPVFVASGHPLSRYIDAHWLPLPHVDMSGGNVTHAAVSLACLLGARRIRVYGADFGYPEGKAYARGTYLYDYFWSDQCRISPAEARFFSFVCGSPDGPARRTRRGGRSVYATPVLDVYRERFLSLAASVDAEVTLIPDSAGGQHGVDAADAAQCPVPVERAAVRPRARDESRIDGTQFLAAYARSLEALPAFSASPPASERELWLTLLPAAARVVKEGHEPGASALEEARRWALERLGRVITSPGGRAQE